jgi:3-O-methylgallate 3,4-dioxygenase
LGAGHAFAFVHSRIFRRRAFRVVPVFLNTYYPPNQPTPRRCYHLGQQIRAAVERWEHDARVAVVASGGLSHFVIDQELDASVLRGIEENDAELLTSLPTAKLNSGTSEIRNWIAMHGATEHLRHEWTGYVPAYRTAAGTGTGCGFGVWK